MTLVECWKLVSCEFDQKIYKAANLLEDSIPGKKKTTKDNLQGVHFAAIGNSSLLLRGVGAAQVKHDAMVPILGVCQKGYSTIH